MYIADLHIHSHYSRATSRDCDLENLDLWARRKGIHLVGTGDFTHPAWREEMADKLRPAEDGLYTLKEEYRIRDGSVADDRIPRFVVTGEISSIYKKYDKVRKVHSLFILSGLEAAGILAKKLELIGNIHSDGRPILGVDCRDLLEIMMELCPDSIYVPAHIWTPHFSVFGSFSKFNSVEECFGDMSKYIHAMETGLSSDPPMNWRVSALDGYRLISNSDAHSPEKLGREANILDTELSYPDLKAAIQEGRGLYGTIEFFPEEGKYHYDGHRKCGVCLSPAETEKYGGICPVCKRKLTVGVSHRVNELADRPEGFVKENARPFESLVPLPEIIASSVGKSSACAKVQSEYRRLLKTLGPEFEILRNIPVEEIRAVSGNVVAEGIKRLREGRVERTPGFDGQYGTIKLFSQSDLDSLEGQMNFFDELPAEAGDKKKEEAVCEAPKGKQKSEEPAVSRDEPKPNEAQEQAAREIGRTVAVIAGPGTGKTSTLISRLAYMLETRRIKPSEITAVTFTNQAAGEMKARVQRKLARSRNLRQLNIGTFHSICYQFLKGRGIDFILADDLTAEEAAKTVISALDLKLSPRQLLRKISLEKAEANENISSELKLYRQLLENERMFDFDDLLLETLQIFEKEEGDFEKPFSYLLVDEFQDINPLQYRLVKAWNRHGRELFVIGDPDQAIYGFRGSDPECFKHLKEDYPKLREICLTENYRCTPAILNAAGALISHNPGGTREFKAYKKEGALIRLAVSGTQMGEAIFVAKEINRIVGGIGMLEAHADGKRQEAVRGFGDIAVLYRTHRQAALLEKCLRIEGIPYVAAGREDFLSDDKVRGTIAFFKTLADPDDGYSKRVCMKLLWNLDNNIVSSGVYEAAAEKFKPKYKKGKPSKVLELWLKELKAEEDKSMQKLADMTVCYKTMPEFIKSVSFGVESDLKRCGQKKYSPQVVRLMTLHGAKGMEFPTVFIYGLRDGIIPFKTDEEETIEEERRLLFVGLTRAREELILTASGEQSEFIRELPERFVVSEKTACRKNDGGGRQMSLFEFI